MYTLAASSFCRKRPFVKITFVACFQTCWKSSISKTQCCDITPLHALFPQRNIKSQNLFAIIGRHDLRNSKVSQNKLLKKYNFNNSQLFVRISEESTEWCLPFRFTRPRFSRNEISSGNLWNGRKNTFMKSLCLQILWNCDIASLYKYWFLKIVANISKLTYHAWVSREDTKVLFVIASLHCQSLSFPGTFEWPRSTTGVIAATFL